MWHDHTKYRNAEDWVFASPAARGQRPYWGQCLMRTIIRPAAAKIGITQHIGWHIFRHTYSPLLRANKTDIKVTQELLRHSIKPGHIGHLYPSSHSTEAASPEQRHSSSAAIRTSYGLRPVLRGLFPLCAYAETHDQRENTGSSMKRIRVDQLICAFFVPI